MQPDSNPIKRALFYAPGKLYELGVRLRIAAYETGYRKPGIMNAPVISIGNLTMGGTGKTPLVHYAAAYLASEGYRVAILTRGYGRKSKGQRVLNKKRFHTVEPVDANTNSTGGKVSSSLRQYEEYGDEPLMLSRMLSEVAIVVNSDRVEAGRWAERELGSNVLLLDDGYQHLAIHRDLNLLVLDATDPFGGEAMVPFGRLREPLYALKRADAIVVTRADNAFDQDQLGATIKYVCGDRIPILYAYSTVTRLRHLENGLKYDTSEFAGWSAYAMCGIGNPRAFCGDLSSAGLSLVGERFFGDHHPFAQQDMDTVNKLAGESNAHLIVTTEKDATRLEGLSLGDVPVYVAESELHSEDEVRLRSLLLKSIVSRARAHENRP